jgi:hypothetical protein
MRTTLMTVCLLAGTAFGQGSREVTRTGSDGSGVERTLGVPASLGGAEAGGRAGLLWTFVDPVSITESVALGDGGGDSWVAHTLNDERMSNFSTTGSGVPDFVYSMAGENPAGIGVAAAAESSLCAVLSWPNGGPITVRAFSDATGDTPLWSYVFGGAYGNTGKRAVAVNADGSRVAACAYDGANTLLVLLDGAGNEIDTLIIAGFCSGVELDDSGDRILVTAGATARLYDAATMTEVYSLAASGSGGYHRISRDGTAIAAGGVQHPGGAGGGGRVAERVLGVGLERLVRAVSAERRRGDTLCPES